MLVLFMLTWHGGGTAIATWPPPPLPQTEVRMPLNAEVKNKLKPVTIEVLRPGTFNGFAITPKHVSDLADAYKAGSEHPTDVPVTLGHDVKSGDPAYGWLENLSMKDGRLVAQLLLTEELAQGFESGKYANVSVSLYDGLKRLRHIAVLGAEQPAVKGMAPVQFADDESFVTVDFTDARTAYFLRAVGDVFQRVRDFIIEQFGADSANGIVPQYVADDLKGVKADPENEDDDTIIPAFSEGEQMELEQAKQKITELEATVSNLTEQVATKTAELATLADAAQKTAKKSRTAQFSQFCDGLIAEGRLFPARKDAVILQMELAHQADAAINLSETEDASNLKALKETLESFPKQIAFGEIATKAAAVSGNGNHEKAEKLITDILEKKGVSYGVALSEVSASNPELFE